jgi:hypothetical protein
VTSEKSSKSAKKSLSRPATPAVLFLWAPPRRLIVLINMASFQTAKPPCYRQNLTVLTSEQSSVCCFRKLGSRWVSGRTSLGSRSCRAIVLFRAPRLCPELCPPLDLQEQAGAARTLPKCRGSSSAGYSWNVALIPAKLLILHASNLCKQGVGGSSPPTSTKHPMFMRLTEDGGRTATEGLILVYVWFTARFTFGRTAQDEKPV